MMKAQRQAILFELIKKGEISSQNEAVRLLRERGVESTQATVSRDLDEIGAVRIREAGNVRYAIVGQSGSFGAPLSVVLRNFVISRIPSGPLAVLRTPPGHANVVAAAIDRAGIPGVIGTLAGDDAIFICGDEEHNGGRGILKALAEIADRPITEDVENTV